MQLRFPASAQFEGLPGKSAYQTAVENGYQGTAAEWLASLKGEPGTNGASTWADVANKPETFPPSPHDHDDRYPAGNPANAPDGHVWTYDAASGGWLPKAPALPAHNHDSLYASSEAPAINVMPDSGRFAGRVNPLGLTLGPAAFTHSPLLAVFGANNVSAAAAGKFTHNNSTNGGTAAALEPTVSDLLAVMGRTATSARNGSEFYVAEYTMGAGTTAPITFSDGVTRYLATTNGAKPVFGVGDLSTAAMWVRCVSGSIVFQKRSLLGLGGVVEQRLGGVEVAGQASNGGIFLAPADGWRHVYVLAKTFAGYDSNHPYIYSTSGSVWQIACPAFYFGRQAPKIHAKPEPTINELSA